MENSVPGNAALEPIMLRFFGCVGAVMMLTPSAAHAQSTPNLNAIYVDQELYRACMNGGRQEGFCNCLANASIKHLKGATNKRIWATYLTVSPPAQALAQGNALRSQLSTPELQAANSQLRAADAAANVCKQQHGIR